MITQPIKTYNTGTEYFEDDSTITSVLCPVNYYTATNSCPPRTLRKIVFQNMNVSGTDVFAYRHNETPQMRFIHNNLGRGYHESKISEKIKRPHHIRKKKSWER